jgi:flagellar assembly protein FliH
MSRKIIGKNRQKQLSEMEITSFGDVEKGETVFRLDMLRETNVVGGEIPFLFANFDTAVNLGKARIVGDSSLILNNVHETEKNEQEEQEKAAAGFSESVFEEAPAEEQTPAIDEELLKELLKAEYDRAFSEGYKKGMQEGADNSRKQYDKERSDYIEMLKGTYSDAVSKLSVFSSAVKELDSALPELLTDFLETLIGTERKMNDRLIVSVITKSLTKLHELSRVVFRVNPDDLETVQEEFPDYDSVADDSIGKGGVKIETNIGEMDYTIETMLGNFEKLIYEELESTQTNKH